VKFSEIVELLSKNGLVTDRSLPYDPKISNISQDSRKSTLSSLFVCINGTHFDSHKIAPSTPASAYVCEYPIRTSKPFVIVKDSRLALSLISYEFYGKAYERLRLFAVTGTKGKTTAVTLFKKIIEEAGQKCALTSTVVNETPLSHEFSKHTTQSSLYTAKLLKKAIDEGSTYASIEASSEGLQMRRLDGLFFDAVAFLNLTRDHFDTHKNFENYFLAKLHLLDLLKPNATAFVNLNAGKWGKRYVDQAIKKGFGVVTFGKDGDVELEVTAENDEGINFTLKSNEGIHRFSSSIIGGFMAENMTASILAARSFGIDWDTIRKAVKKFQGVEGRMERYVGKEYDFYIDFAHAPGALEASLKTIKKLTSGRVILVFGAGGERDKGIRPLMGNVAQKYADVIILTNDNPKGEDPLEIIKEVALGITEKSFQIIPDRKSAIKTALLEWREGDRVVIAGKGHEKTQIFNGYEIPFNDKKVTFEILRELGKS
jgi:UDP-N-acetylmuramoyl-L-alanyl-D-glutamate--2,6-diaminopimelate ligase